MYNSSSVAGMKGEKRDRGKVRERRGGGRKKPERLQRDKDPFKGMPPPPHTNAAT